MSFVLLISKLTNIENQTFTNKIKAIFSSKNDKRKFEMKNGNEPRIFFVFLVILQLLNIITIVSTNRF